MEAGHRTPSPKRSRRDGRQRSVTEGQRLARQHSTPQLTPFDSTELTYHWAELCRTAVQNAAHAIDNWLSRDAVDPSPDRLALTQMRQDAQQRVDELAAMGDVHRQYLRHLQTPHHRDLDDDEQLREDTPPFETWEDTSSEEGNARRSPRRGKKGDTQPPRRGSAQLAVQTFLELTMANTIEPAPFRMPTAPQLTFVPGAKELTTVVEPPVRRPLPNVEAALSPTHRDPMTLLTALDSLLSAAVAVLQQGVKDVDADIAAAAGDAGQYLRMAQQAKAGGTMALHQAQRCVAALAPLWQQTAERLDALAAELTGAGQREAELTARLEALEEELRRAEARRQEPEPAPGSPGGKWGPASPGGKWGPASPGGPGSPSGRWRAEGTESLAPPSVSIMVDPATASPGPPNPDGAPEGCLALAACRFEGLAELHAALGVGLLTSLNMGMAHLLHVGKLYGGYVVHGEGDRCLVAFPAIDDAIRFAVETQRGLLSLAWPKDLLRVQVPVHCPSGTLLWRGLRVATALHCGTPAMARSAVTFRADYFGPVLDTLWDLHLQARGGEVAVSADAYEAAQQMANQTLFNSLRWETVPARLPTAPAPLLHLLAPPELQPRLSPAPLPFAADPYRSVLGTWVEGQQATLAQSALSLETLLTCTAGSPLVQWIDGRPASEVDIFAALQRPALPPGELAFVVVDVLDGRGLWDWDHDVMREALAIFLTVLCLEAHPTPALLVGRTADGLTLAFPTPRQAVRYALDVQRALLYAPWPPRLLAHDKGGPRPTSISDDTPVLRGLRPRIAIAWGSATWIAHKREYDSFAQRTAAALRAYCRPGDVLLAAPLPELKDDDHFVGAIQDLGERSVKGVQGAVHVWRLTARSLLVVDPPFRPDEAGALDFALRTEREAKTQRLALMQKVATVVQGALPTAEGTLPRGLVTLVRVEVAGAREKAETYPLAVADSVAALHRLIKPSLTDLQGHLVRRDYDVVTAAFRGADAACRWAAGALALGTQWHKGPEVEGLGLCIGIHTGEPYCLTDPAGKTTYHGPPLRIAAHLAALCPAGELCLTAEVEAEARDALREAKGLGLSLPHACFVHDHPGPLTVFTARIGGPSKGLRWDETQQLVLRWWGDRQAKEHVAQTTAMALALGLSVAESITSQLHIVDKSGARISLESYLPSAAGRLRQLSSTSTSSKGKPPAKAALPLRDGPTPDAAAALASPRLPPRLKLEGTGRDLPLPARSPRASPTAPSKALASPRSPQSPRHAAAAAATTTPAPMPSPRLPKHTTPTAPASPMSGSLTLTPPPSANPAKSPRKRGKSDAFVVDLSADMMLTPRRPSAMEQPPEPVVVQVPRRNAGCQTAQVVTLDAETEAKPECCDQQVQARVGRAGELGGAGAAEPESPVAHPEGKAPRGLADVSTQTDQEEASALSAMLEECLSPRHAAPKPRFIASATVATQTASDVGPAKVVSPVATKGRAASRLPPPVAAAGPLVSARGKPKAAEAGPRLGKPEERPALPSARGSMRDAPPGPPTPERRVPSARGSAHTLPGKPGGRRGSQPRRSPAELDAEAEAAGEGGPAPPPADGPQREQPREEGGAEGEGAVAAVAGDERLADDPLPDAASEGSTLEESLADRGAEDALDQSAASAADISPTSSQPSSFHVAPAPHRPAIPAVVPPLLPLTPAPPAPPTQPVAATVADQPPPSAPLPETKKPAVDSKPKRPPGEPENVRADFVALHRRVEAFVQAAAGYLLDKRQWADRRALDPLLQSWAPSAGAEGGRRASPEFTVLSPGALEALAAQPFDAAPYVRSVQGLLLRHFRHVQHVLLPLVAERDGEGVVAGPAGQERVASARPPLRAVAQRGSSAMPTAPPVRPVPSFYPAVPEGDVLHVTPLRSELLPAAVAAKGSATPEATEHPRPESSPANLGTGSARLAGRYSWDGARPSQPAASGLPDPQRAPLAPGGFPTAGLSAPPSPRQTTASSSVFVHAIPSGAMGPRASVSKGFTGATSTYAPDLVPDFDIAGQRMAIMTSPPRRSPTRQSPARRGPDSPLSPTAPPLESAPFDWATLDVMKDLVPLDGIWEARLLLAERDAATPSPPPPPGASPRTGPSHAAVAPLKPSLSAALTASRLQRLLAAEDFSLPALGRPSVREETGLVISSLMPLVPKPRATPPNHNSHTNATGRLPQL